MRWAAGDRNFVLYADDSRITGRDHEWVQGELTVTVAMFRRIVIDAKLENTKAMICTPRFIWEEWGETVYNQRVTGEGVNFRERKKTQVSDGGGIIFKGAHGTNP